MITKHKRWSAMSLDELAEATKEFDDPNYDPPAQKPSKEESGQLRRVRRKSAKDRSRVAIALEENLIEEADQYAADHGMTFSQVVSNALRRLMHEKPA